MIDSNDRIGLGPAPWNDGDWQKWPTHGYDSEIAKVTYDDEPKTFADSGYSREEWLALADEMIARWTAWRAHIASLPPKSD
jgi:hypothetical protein